jgi:hypothetical protein
VDESEPSPVTVEPSPEAGLTPIPDQAKQAVSRQHPSRLTRPPNTVPSQGLLFACNAQGSRSTRPNHETPVRALIDGFGHSQIGEASRNSPARSFRRSSWSMDAAEVAINELMTL